MDIRPNQSEQESQKENSNPTIRREDVRRAMALSDEKSRLSDAKEKGKIEGIITVAKRLLDSGIPLNEVAGYTPYDAQELQQLIKNYR